MEHTPTRNFHCQNVRPSINELWVSLVFYLKLTCLNIYINIYTHAQSLEHSIVLRCHRTWHVLVIIIQCSSDCVPTYIVYATPSCNSPHKSKEEHWIQSKEGFRILSPLAWWVVYDNLFCKCVNQRYYRAEYWFSVFSAPGFSAYCYNCFI